MFIDPITFFISVSIKITGVFYLNLISHNYICYHRSIKHVISLELNYFNNESEVVKHPALEYITLPRIGDKYKKNTFTAKFFHQDYSKGIRIHKYAKHLLINLGLIFFLR